MKHIPVLLKEVIEYLAPASGKIYLDGTLGAGGYAEKILEASAPDGKVIGIDIDDEALNESRARLSAFKERIKIERKSYAEIAAMSKEWGILFDGIVLDLGISSMQIDTGERGFSFMKNGPLDMRMDKNSGLTAEYIVNAYSKDELKEVFLKFGEEKFAGRVAEKIVGQRGMKAITTTEELENICYKAYPQGLRHSKTHPATRVFQALRIAVNGELDNLEQFLCDAPECLKIGGRVVIVSYHSLEDRLVKNRFKEFSAGGKAEILTKKPVPPAEEETKNNPRARSAKLRAICLKFPQTI
ncbi:MAG: 16S rRNA (cytosine(1402)-N(4))-methyltransferase RsmH [Deltaproteobacteria bacterium]|nr:16S rRNA (cytosine(1402)-N(4))-methyltransferase RsmH [Deltaproteobacteria bacterium]MBI2974163.1 16S rRNA (cytosine(1402)-N(4))-methyltransferase RsmH [Deltaproteobacteria bacterium]